MAQLALVHDATRLGGEKQKTSTNRRLREKMFAKTKVAESIWSRIPKLDSDATNAIRFLALSTPVISTSSDQSSGSIDITGSIETQATKPALTESITEAIESPPWESNIEEESVTEDVDSHLLTQEFIDEYKRLTQDETEKQRLVRADFSTRVYDKRLNKRVATTVRHMVPKGYLDWLEKSTTITNSKGEPIAVDLISLGNNPYRTVRIVVGEPVFVAGVRLFTNHVVKHVRVPVSYQNRAKSMHFERKFRSNRSAYGNSFMGYDLPKGYGMSADDKAEQKPIVVDEVTPCSIVTEIPAADNRKVLGVLEYKDSVECARDVRISMERRAFLEESREYFKGKIHAGSGYTYKTLCLHHIPQPVLAKTTEAAQQSKIADETSITLGNDILHSVSDEVLLPDSLSQSLRERARDALETSAPSRVTRLLSGPVSEYDRILRKIDPDKWEREKEDLAWRIAAENNLVHRLKLKPLKGAAAFIAEEYRYRKYHDDLFMKPVTTPQESLFLMEVRNHSLSRCSPVFKRVLHKELVEAHEHQPVVYASDEKEAAADRLMALREVVIKKLQSEENQYELGIVATKQVADDKVEQVASEINPANEDTLDNDTVFQKILKESDPSNRVMLGKKISDLIRGPVVDMRQLQQLISDSFKPDKESGILVPT